METGTCSCSRSHQHRWTLDRTMIIVYCLQARLLLTKHRLLNSHPSLQETRAILSALSPRLKTAKPRARTRKAEAVENITSSPYKNGLISKEATRLGRGVSKAKRKIEQSFGEKPVPAKKRAELDTTPCCIFRKHYCDLLFED